MKKKYLIDIYHLPQFNLFKNAIKILGPENVDLSCVNRGKLLDVIKYECPDFKLYVFNNYKENKGAFSLIFKIILPRMINLAKLFKRKKYAVVGTSSYQSIIVAKLNNIPNFAIFDDPRNVILQIFQMFTDKCYLPPYSKTYWRINKLNALKEWAYLSPKYFKPNKKSLEEYNLIEKKYIFIREVSTKTLNYISQSENLILQLSKKLDKKIKVVLSLEVKENRDKYPENWIILNEPVTDIHSLMYYSNLVISSGDSMAREGAMLGVPSIYLGNRIMPANMLLIDKGILFKMTLEESIDFIYNHHESKNKQDYIRTQLDKEWDDVTQLIINIFKKLEK